MSVLLVCKSTLRVSLWSSQLLYTLAGVDLCEEGHGIQRGQGLKSWLQKLLSAASWYLEI
jgi:hypothetical protein